MAANIFLHLPAHLKMPAIGLGTFEAKDESELEHALDAALEAGYRHIDTAWVYENEKIIGTVLKKWFDSGRISRDEVFITTKLPMIGVHPDRVEMFIKKSLTNLQLDCVDLYLVHFPVGCKYQEGAVRPTLNQEGEIECERKTDHAAIWKKMEEQVDAGRARAIGLSNYTIPQIDVVLKAAKIIPASLQVELHVYLQQRELVEYCQKNGIAVVAYSPLGNPGYNKFLKKFGKEERQLPNILGDPVVNQIAEKHSKTPSQIALRFLLQRGVAAIPKSVTPKRIEENINVFNFGLDDGDMKALLNLEIGEDARVCDFKHLTGMVKHPDFFPKTL